MSKIKIGDAKAYCKQGNDKTHYYKVGVLYKDSERGNLSLKIDTLPIQDIGWNGWINIFEENKKESSGPDTPTYPICEDDIPF